MKCAKLIVAASAYCSDMLYATGFMAIDPYVYFKCGDIPAMVLSPLEFCRGQAEHHPGVQVFRSDDFTQASGTLADVVIGIAEKYDIKSFIVPRDFPLYLAEKIRMHGLLVECNDSDFLPERSYKSDTEAMKIAEAMFIAEKGMQRAWTILHESGIGAADNSLLWKGQVLTSELLRSEINVEIVRYGGVADATIAACGTQSSEPHNVGHGLIYAGQPIVVDIFPRSLKNGYWGDITRTWVKGEATDIVKRAYEAVMRTRDGAKQMIKAGAIPANIHEFALKTLEHCGFHTGRTKGRDFGFFHGLGHSIGLDIHESPRINLRNHEPLRGREIITVEPGVYYPEWGGVRLEDVVLVNDDCCQCLTLFETNLEIQ
jgi:Xaa-Pro aminopeptidase